MNQEASLPVTTEQGLISETSEFFLDTKDLESSTTIFPLVLHKFISEVRANTSQLKTAPTSPEQVCLKTPEKQSTEPRLHDLVTLNRESKADALQRIDSLKEDCPKGIKQRRRSEIFIKISTKSDSGSSLWIVPPSQSLNSIPSYKEAQKKNSYIGTTPRRGSAFFQRIFSERRSSDLKPSRLYQIVQDKATSPMSSFKETARFRVYREKKNIFKLKKVLQKHANYDVDQGKLNFLRLIEDAKKAKNRTFSRIKFKLFKRAANCWPKGYGLKSKFKQLMTPISPDSLFKLVWDLILLLCIIIDLGLLPFSIAFENKLTEYQHAFTVYNNVLLGFFLVDIFINFNIAVNLEGTLVKDRKIIGMRYLNGWFLIDLISTFPFQDILESLANSTNSSNHLYFRAFRFLRFFRVIRAIRVIKLKSLFHEAIKHIGSNSSFFNGIASLIKLCMIIFFLAHWCACIWYFIGRSEDSYTWLDSSLLANESISQQYVAALYFAVMTMMTVGYGDIIPVTIGERLFAIFVMLLGGGIFGFTLSSITEIAKSLEDEEAKRKKNIYTTTRYMQQQGVDKRIQDEVQKYLEFMLEAESQNKQIEKQMLGMLPSHLQSTVNEQMNRRFINGNKALQNILSPKLIQFIASKVEGRICSPNEVIFDTSDQDLSFYFIVKGRAALYYPRSEVPLIELNKTQGFGEVSFFSGEQRRLVARSHSFSQLLFFQRDSLLQALEKFPFDKEMYCMIRDNMVLYKKYSMLGLKCHTCDKNDHTDDNCTQAYFAPDRSEVIKQHLANKKRHRREFRRRLCCRPHTKANLGALAEASKRICENLSRSLENLIGNSETKSLKETEDISRTEVFEFDRVKSFEIYFSHNNVSKICEMKRNELQRNVPDVEKLRDHLGRFFKTMEGKERYVPYSK